MLSDASVCLSDVDVRRGEDARERLITELEENNRAAEKPRCLSIYLQRSAKVFVRGCEKFVTALAYLFCLALVGSCLARFAYSFADLCTC